MISILCTTFTYLSMKYDLDDPDRDLSVLLNRWERFITAAASCFSFEIDPCLFSAERPAPRLLEVLQWSKMVVKIRVHK